MGNCFSISVFCYIAPLIYLTTVLKLLPYSVASRRKAPLVKTEWSASNMVKSGLPPADKDFHL